MSSLLPSLHDHLYNGSFLIGDMHLRGVMIDRDYVDKLDRDLKYIIKEAERDCREIQPNVSPGNPFEVLPALQKRGHKLTSTSKEILKDLDDPYADAILEFRKWHKLHSTYITSLDKYVDPYDYIHAQFNPASTVTGRLSSNNPNLQNIPRGSSIRGLFVPSPGYRFIDADFAQIEFRVAAGLSQDPVLLEYINAGRDVHKEVAAVAFKILYEDVTKELRTKAKEIVFGGLFLMQPKTLAHKLNISIQEAEYILDVAYGKFIVLKQWRDDTCKQAVEVGYSETRLGRRRYYPLITPHNVNQIKRYAVNTPVQGHASDICWDAAITIAKESDPAKLRPVMLVHDAIIFEEREDCDYLDYVVERMATSPLGKDLNIRLDVDAKRCSRWGE